MTPERFEVGEVAIYVRNGSVTYGDEVTVVGALKPRLHYDVDGKPLGIVETYAIANAGWGTPDAAQQWGAEPHELKKKRPPKESLGKWEEIERDLGWSPRIRVV